MNALDITRSYINETAQQQGFQRDTLEKVVRLYYVLKDMSEAPLFKDNLALYSNRIDLRKTEKKGI